MVKRRRRSRSVTPNQHREDDVPALNLNFLPTANLLWLLVVLKVASPLSLFMIVVLLVFDDSGIKRGERELFQLRKSPFVEAERDCCCVLVWPFCTHSYLVLFSTAAEIPPSYHQPSYPCAQIYLHSMY